MPYRKDSIIRYRLWDGTERTVTVTEVLPDVKNGKPGFGGREYLREGALGPQYQEVWGYDSQITEVVRF